MRNVRYAAAILATYVFSAGCTLNKPWRTTPDPRPDPQERNGASTTIDRLASGDDVDCLRPFSEERLTSASGPPFSLYEIEFDDQGRMWNRERATVSLDRIAMSARRGARIVVFAHGWDNNAKVCNGKLTCFRELLQVFVRDEMAYSAAVGVPAREIVGLYIGWRGQSVSSIGFDWTNIPVLKAIDLKYLTFWSRKQVAHAIGGAGAATEVLSRLDELRCHAGRLSALETGQADTRCNPATSVIFMGHSFGGALMYSASEAILNNRLARLRQAVVPPAGKPREVDRIVTASDLYDGFADLVVLENPALEAELYHNIDSLSGSLKDLSSYQLPLLLTISSEGDTANSILFPFGRIASTFLQSARSSEQWQSMIQSVGTYADYHTHKLVATAPHPQPAKVAGCICESGLRERESELVSELEPFYDYVKSVRADYRLADLALADARAFRFSRLEPFRPVDENEPYMLIRADRNVVNDHSDLFNVNYVDFLLEFIRLVEIKKELIRGNAVEVRP